MIDLTSVDRDFKLWVLLHQTRDAVHKSAEKELRRFGLSPMEAALLFAVHAIGERATPAEISRWLFRESHSVSGLLDRMEKKGLVSWNIDAGSSGANRGGAPKRRFELTEAGLDALRVTQEAVGNLAAGLESQISGGSR